MSCVYHKLLGYKQLGVVTPGMKIIRIHLKPELISIEQTNGFLFVYKMGAFFTSSILDLLYIIIISKKKEMRIRLLVYRIE